LVVEKSNEIPAARALFARLGSPDGKLVRLDALHTNQATLRTIQQAHGTGYPVPIKANHAAFARGCASVPAGPAADRPCRRAPALAAAPRAGGSPPRPPALPPPPCATAASEETNRGRREKRSLRWIATKPETLGFVGARSVVEVIRAVTVFKGRHRGKHTVETDLLVSSLRITSENALNILLFNSSYWRVEAGCHRLDVTAREDASRVRDRNSLRVLGIVRRITPGFHQARRVKRKTSAYRPLKTSTTPWIATSIAPLGVSSKPPAFSPAFKNPPRAVC